MTRAALMIGIILAACLVNRAPGGPTSQPSTTQATSQPAPALAWYTTDDGKTYFKDSAAKVPPFNHNGKDAVRCYVFRIGKGPPFVAYLERWDPEGKKLLADAQAKGPVTVGWLLQLMDEHLERKRPGDKEWSMPGATRISTHMPAVAPDGRQADLQAVYP